MGLGGWVVYGVRSPAQVAKKGIIWLWVKANGTILG